MLKRGQILTLCVLGLLSVGVVMVNSAGLRVGTEEPVTLQSILLSRSTGYMCLALLALLLVSIAPIRRWAQTPGVLCWTPLLLPLIVFLLLLVYAPGIGHETKGSNRWVRVPGLGITAQPSEIAKWSLILLLAWHGWRNLSKIDRFWAGALPGLVCIGLIAAIVAKEDLGSGLLIGSAGLIMLLAAGVRWVHLLPAAPVALAGFIAALVLSPYRIRRLTSFLDPYASADAEGYHLVQSLVAIANGGGFGRGIGFGLQKFGYLPEDTTDFLFAVICEELGIAGALLVIAMYGVLLWMAWHIVRDEVNGFLKLVGVGVLATLGLQTVMNLAVVTGLMPPTGIALPLISSGGTGWILTATSLGLLVAMDRTQTARVEEKLVETPEPAGPLVAGASG